jgi:hypothetical protein
MFGSLIIGSNFFVIQVELIVYLFPSLIQLYWSHKDLTMKFLLPGTKEAYICHTQQSPIIVAPTFFLLINVYFHMISMFHFIFSKNISKVSDISENLTFNKLNQSISTYLNIV